MLCYEKDVVNAKPIFSLDKLYDLLFACNNNDNTLAVKVKIKQEFESLPTFKIVFERNNLG